MTNVLAPYSESKLIYNGYANMNMLNNSMTFIIPVYNNMPETPVENPNIIESDFTNDNTKVYADVQTTLNIREGPSSSYEILTSVDRKVEMTRLAKGKQSGELWDKVQLPNGIIGYAFQSYLKEVPEKQIEKINVSAEKTTINKGETIKLKVEIMPEEAKDHEVIYTSSDSVLQICASEETVGLKELYRVCEIARKLCMKDEWFVGRIIARPYVGKTKETFKRTSNRHDYAISPTSITAMNILKNNNIEVNCVGKINDIFNGSGVTSTVHIDSNIDGMNKTIAKVKDESFKKGFLFVNLVEFDSEFGHRRNPIGYGKAIEQFDVQLKELISSLRDDDLLMITADHGNDPTWKGTDHTREQVPLLCYSKEITNGKKLAERNTFADIGASILYNFNLEKDKVMIGEKIKELFD